MSDHFGTLCIKGLNVAMIPDLKTYLVNKMKEEP